MQTGEKLDVSPNGECGGKVYELGLIKVRYIKVTFEEFSTILSESNVYLRHRKYGIYELRVASWVDGFITIDLNSEKLIYCYQWDNLDLSLSPLDLSVILSALYKLQETPVEDRCPAQKYTIQTIAGNSQSYLNYFLLGKRFIFGDAFDTADYQVSFTKDEINELKKRDDIAIDWNKAIIKDGK